MNKVVEGSAINWVVQTKRKGKQVTLVEKLNSCQDEDSSELKDLRTTK